MRVLLIILLIGFTGRSQNDSTSFQWNLKRSYPIASNGVWTSDALENVYTGSDGVINKFDSSGVLKFSQSIKSLGNMTALIPLNTMKLVHFSDEQQTLCYFDNTLTQNESCRDLVELQVTNAKLVCGSDRSNMIWVYDEVNSRLSLFNMEENAHTVLEHENLKGLIQIENVRKITERGGYLFILDNDKVFILDIYGSFVDLLSYQGVRDISASGNQLFVLLESTMHVYNVDTGLELHLDLPIKDIVEIQHVGNKFFFRTSSNVHKFTLQKP